MSEKKTVNSDLSIINYLSEKPFEFFVFFICSIVSTYLVIKLNIGENIFIGNADQSNVANLARNIAEGNGAVVDNVWLMVEGGLPGNNATHAEPYWSVYVAAMIAPFFKAFGASRLTLILPALLIKVIIVGIVAWVIHRITPGKQLPTILAIVLTSFSIPLINAINGFSDIYLTLFVLLTGLTLFYALSMKKWYLFLLAGIFAGISVGVKPSGILLLGVWPVYFVFCKYRIRLIRDFIIFFIGMIFSLTPYIIYNQLNFDTFAPPGLALVVKSASIRDSIIANDNEVNDNKTSENKFGHAHRKGFYDPDSTLKTLTKPEGSSFQIEKLIERLKTFIQRSFIWGMLIPIWLVPFVLLGVAEIIIRIKSRVGNKPRQYNLFLVFCILMLISGFVLALRVSFEVRYWNYMVPLAIVVAIIGVLRLPTVIPLLLVLLSLYSGLDHLINHEGLKINTPAYAKAVNILPKEAKVLTSSPWQFAFYTRFPSVMLPYTDNAQTIRDTAKRYGVEYIAIVDNDTKHPYYFPLQNEGAFDYLNLVYRDENLILFKFK
jgi:4-amino-4-deoxy-L-arabinose transferase-like glycosyltransferase